ncbi:DUF4907 domain-containing protein [Panacibacter ginsenosidivorans]|nr:DUF4907 domain-containing protein [Panacibacter ginsenosidivorans]
MKSYTIHKYFGVLLFIISLLYVENIQAQNLQQSSGINTTTKFNYKIIDAPDKTFGYDVYADDKLLIHQTNKPAMPGSKAFATKKDAVKIAELVIEKLRKGIMPPTVSKEELQMLKVIR